MTDEEIGEELRQFFLGLLANGSAMAQYQNPETRTDAIRTIAHSDVQTILETGTLAQIEAYLRLVTGNPVGAARPTLVVWPPM